MEKPEIPHRLRALIGQSVDAIDTPALVVDLDAANRNLQRMAEFAAKHRLRLRPHAKMHKSAFLARLQMQAGAVGVCVQKTSEAEALAELWHQRVRSELGLVVAHCTRICLNSSRAPGSRSMMRATVLWNFRRVSPVAL